jgi:hypothetical protein
MVLDATFNNKPEDQQKTTDLSQVTDKLDHIMFTFSADIQGQERVHIMHECTLCNPNDGKFSIQSAFNVLTDWD